MASNIVAQMQVLISAQTKGLNTALSQSTSAFNSFQKTAVSVGNTLKGFVGVGLFVGIGKAVIDATAEFEKFEAVLTNTLGSSSAAKKALDGIRDFAQSTPFEVSEITAAYVRWANQGLTPTIDKMNKLGDVASSLGAGFEQTAEAFKDLLVGQTKRIEEIGIQATQSNGKIQLSFKGVTIDIKKNVAGVEKALNTYSQLDGVLGTSAAVSATLGGRISNLSDAWTNFLVTIGSGNGIIAGAVTALTSLINATNDLLESLTNVQKAEFKKFTKNLAETVKDDSVLIKDMVNKLSILRNELDTPISESFAKQVAKEFELSTEQTERFLKIIKEINGVEKVAPPVPVETITSLATLHDELDKLNKQFKETDIKDKASLENTAKDILAKQAEIATIEVLIQKHKELNKEKTPKKVASTFVPGLDVSPFEDTTFTIPVPDADAQIDALNKITQATVDSNGVVQDSNNDTSDSQNKIIDNQRLMIDTAFELGEALASSSNRGQAVIKALLQAAASAAKKFILQSFQESVAGVTAGAAKTKAPPPVILALAALGIAGISAIFSKIGGPSGSGGIAGGGIGGRATTNVSKAGTAGTFGESISFDAKFLLEGPNLAATVGTDDAKRKRRLGG